MVLFEVLGELDLVWNGLLALSRRITKVLLVSRLVSDGARPVVDELAMRVHVGRVLTLRLHQVVQIVLIHLIDGSGLGVLNHGGT